MALAAPSSAFSSSRGLREPSLSLESFPPLASCQLQAFAEGSVALQSDPRSPFCTFSPVVLTDAPAEQVLLPHFTQGGRGGGALNFQKQ